MAHEESRKDVRVGVAWFRAEQWARLLEISIDRDTLEDSHAEWARGAAKSLNELRLQGLTVEKVDVDVEELRQWCLDHGLMVDASARANFVAERLRQRHETR